MQRAAFIRHVTTLLSGKVASQVLSLALVPFIARLFEPADFGALAIFVALSQALGIVGPMRYFRGALLTRDDERAEVLMAISARLLAAGCLCVALLILAGEIFDAKPALTKPLGSWLWALPISGFLAGMCTIASTDNTRRRTFFAVAKSDMANVLLMGVSRIAFGLSGSSVWGLVVGFLLGSVGRLWMLTRNAVSPFRLLTLKVSWSRTKTLLIEYRDFPLFNTPAGMVTFLGGKLPILVMGAMFTPSVVGLYAMGDRLIRMPVKTAGSSIREVFMQKVSTNASAGQSIKRPMTMLTLLMLAVGTVPFGLLAFFGTEILTLVLGQKWVEAGKYVQILAPWYYAVWVTTGVQPTLIAMRRQKVWLMAQVCMLIIRLSVFGAGFAAGVDALTTLKWFSAANVMISVSMLALVFYLLANYEGSSESSGSPSP